MGSRSRALLAVAALISLATAPRADARRLFVPREHRTIQAAINAASPGDTVWIAAGTYPGTITLKKPLVLFGAGGPDSTILDGGDSVRVLHIEGVKGATVVGFKIRRGKATSGGGIYCLRDTSLMIATCIVERNWESGLGAWQCQDLNLMELRFVENLGSGVAFYSSTGLLRLCAFEGNKGYTGGGLALTNSRIILPMRNCSFVGNRAEGSTGGAINADSSDVQIAECQFLENTAKVAGGAVAAMNGSQIAISRSRLSKNRAATGGGAHSGHSTMNVAFSIFDGNRSNALGSALGFVGRRLANINPTIANNTFYKNVAENEGATIFCESVSPEIRKNIFVLEGGQRAAGAASASPLFECNLLHDPSGTGLASLPSAETLVGDPLFCDPENDDFFLRDLSPAILATCGPIGALPKRCTTFKMAPGR